MKRDSDIHPEACNPLDDWKGFSAPFHPSLAKSAGLPNQKRVISVEEAEKKISEKLVPLGPEQVEIEQVNGRVLAEPLQSDRDLPPFHRSTFDGFALSYQAITEGQRTFPIRGTAYAGSPQMTLEDTKACIEIMTGAPLPDHTNCVVKIEDTEVLEGSATINEGVEFFEGFGVHPRASDCPAGKTLLRPGCRLTAKELSIAASIGKSYLPVFRNPRISIVTTGDELVNISDSPLPHQIRRSNDLALEMALESAGYSSISRHHIPDDPIQTESVVDSLLDEVDVLILAGGVSKGKRDYLPTALEKAGVEKAFQWVSQRPGKPLWFGSLEKNEGQTLVFALPGNPVSCFTCLHRYVLPALAEITGLSPAPPLFAKLKSEYTFAPPLTLFLPVTLNCDESGQLWAEPLPSNTSGDYISVARTHGFVELPASESFFEEGTSCRFFPWQT